MVELSEEERTITLLAGATVTEPILEEEILIGCPFEYREVNYMELIPPARFLGFNKAISSLSQLETHESMAPCNSRPLKTIKNVQQVPLGLSISKYNMFNPLHICELPESEREAFKEWIIEENYKRTAYNFMSQYGKYIIIDGQRRYYAIAEKIEGTSNLYKTGIRCLVYPHETYAEMRRHSIEDNKFSVRPSSAYLDIANLTI